MGSPGFEIPGISGNDIMLEYVACSGAILRNLTAVPQDARGETHIVQAQRVDAAADLVTFTIGGNDVGFSEIMKHCATQADCWEDGFAPLNSGASLSADDYLLARVILFLPEARSFYSELRNQTDDNATIVALNYPELFDDGINVRFGCKEAALFSRAERQWINNRTVLFRDLLERATGQSGIWFVDVVDEFKQRRVCDGGINDNGEWLVGHETAAKAAGDASFHPNANGAQAYARLISEFLNAQVNAGVPLNPSGLPLNPGAVANANRVAAPAALLVASAPALQAEESTPFPQITADTLPTLLDLGYSAEDIAEIEAMSFGLAEVTGLSARRGDATCSNVTTAGEQLVVEGYGFAPGSTVELFLKSNTEADRRTGFTPLIADEAGLVRTSIIVPTDLLEDPDPLIHAGITIGFEGIGSETGGYRRVDESLFVDLENSDCSLFIQSAGDTSPDGSSPAPSAPQTPGTPELVNELPSLLAAGGCTIDADITGLNVIVGTNRADTLTGTSGNDLILGGPGNDVILGMNGDDIICGGSGDDDVSGNNGQDVVDGGNGDDQVAGGNGIDQVNGSAGDDVLDGGNGKDALDGGEGTDTGDGGRGKNTCTSLETSTNC